MAQDIVKIARKEAKKIVIESDNRKQHGDEEMTLINGLCCKSRNICIFMDFSLIFFLVEKKSSSNPEKKSVLLNLDQISFISLPFTV